MTNNQSIKSYIDIVLSVQLDNQRLTLANSHKRFSIYMLVAMSFLLMIATSTLATFTPILTIEVFSFLFWANLLSKVFLVFLLVVSFFLFISVFSNLSKSEALYGSGEHSPSYKLPLLIDQVKVHDVFQYSAEVNGNLIRVSSLLQVSSDAMIAYFTLMSVSTIVNLVAYILV